ncbi:hypothetical protein HDV05_007620 [Chytridiales sp. JEL 0842]|nr:hypothetical protein HDV05_007620 [Chytridiales sp. JEL 0842]
MQSCQKNTRKVSSHWHGLIQLASCISLFIAIYAIYENKASKNKGHLKTLHALFGYSTFASYLAIALLGGLSRWAPVQVFKSHLKARKWYPTHRTIGYAVWVLLMTTMCFAMISNWSIKSFDLNAKHFATVTLFNIPFHLGYMARISYITFFALVCLFLLVTADWQFVIGAKSSRRLGSIPLKIRTLSPGTCTTTLTQTRSILNPFSSIHAAALINMGEATCGLAMLTWQEHGKQKKGTRCIPVEITGRFLKKARGVLECVVDVEGAEGGDGLMLKAGEEVGRKDVTAILKDKSGDVVAEVVVIWSISSKAGGERKKEN